MLTLASLVDVLKNVALDLHVVVWIVSICSIVLYLIDQTVEIVILNSRVIARRSMWLLTLHPTLIVLYIQIKLVLWVFAVILSCPSNVPSHRILADFLLEKLLICLILLSVLLKKLP